MAFWQTAFVALLTFFQAPDYQTAGLKALDDQHYPQAVEIFQKAIAADAGDYSAHFNLALAYSLMEKPTAAIPEYRKTLELKPGIYAAQLNLGILLIGEKKPHEALPFLKDAAAQKPKEFRPTFYLGEALLPDAPAEAEKQYLSALAIDPKSAAAELGLAHAVLNQNRLDDAVPHFEKAAALDAHYRDSLLELAAAYEDKNRNDPAILIYEQFPDNPGAQEHLGELLLKGDNAAKAIPRLLAAVEKSPSAANRATLAVAYVKAKDLDKALPLAAQAVEAEPKDFQLRMLYGRILRDKRSLNPAAEQFLKAAQLKPDSAEAWSEMAGVLVVAENYRPALGALDRLKALNAEKPGHLFLRAMVLDHLQQRPQALESYQKFLELDQGKSDKEDFQARQRIRALEREAGKNKR